MVAWNPTNPDAIGLQWSAVTEGVVLLDSATAVAPAQIVSTATETIDQFQVAHKWLSSPASGYGRLWTDVYDLAGTSNAPGVAGVTELTYAPNEDKARSNTFQSDLVTTTNLYQSVDDPDDTVDPFADYVASLTSGYASFQFNTAAIAATYRIVYVRFEMRAGSITGVPTVSLDCYNNATLVGRIAQQELPSDGAFHTYTYGPYYYDFFNEGPWLQPEIAAYDDNTKRNIRVVYSTYAAVTRLAMIVGVIPENRVAVGIGTKVTVPTVGTVTNNPILVKTPLGVDNWAKATGKSYLAVTRRLEDPFSALATLTPQVVYLDSAAASPVDQGLLYASTTAANQSGVLSSIGTTTSTKYASLVLGTSGAAESVDSQPYWDVEAKAVNVNQPLSQALSAATAASQYARLRVIASTTGTAPTVPLVFGLRKTSVVDVTDAFTAAISASFTAGSFTAGAAASAATNQLVYTTGTTANAYARHRTTNAQSNTVLLTGKVTFASIASAHYGLIGFSASTTFTSTGTNPGLTSGYLIRMAANGTVGIYTAGAATAGTEVLLASVAFAFTTAQHSFKLVRLSQGFIGFKVWATAGTEPTTWTLAWTDSTYSGTFLALGAQNDAAGGTSRTVSFDDFSLTNYLSAGDLTNADLADTTIATSKGSIAYTPGTLPTYDATITMDTPVTLAAATDYTIDVVSTQLAASSWYLLWLDGTATHALTGNNTYQGSTDSAAFGMAASTAKADMMITLGTIPSAPATLTVAVQSTAFANNGGAKCDAGSLQYPRLTWTATTLGATFARYEISRSYDLGVTWTAAATIAAESTVTWDNREVRRGVAVMYRIRVVRSDLAPSLWRTQTGTVTTAAEKGVLAIVSDTASAAIGGYVLLGATQPYGFADQTSYMTVHGRDYQLGFKSPQIGSVVWEFAVLIYAVDEDYPTLTPDGGAGVQAFAALRAIARSTAPYLALITPDGELLCGTIEVPSATRTEPAHEYIAMVKFTQTQASPSVVAA